MSAVTTEPAALDPLVVSVIVEGRFSDAGKAIGSANLATLQAAVQDCAEAAEVARRRGRPFGQYQDRACLCRGRIRKIAEKQKTNA